MSLLDAFGRLIWGSSDDDDDDDDDITEMINAMETMENYFEATKTYTLSVRNSRQKEKLMKYAVQYASQRLFSSFTPYFPIKVPEPSDENYDVIRIYNYIQNRWGDTHYRQYQKQITTGSENAIRQLLKDKQFQGSWLYVDDDQQITFRSTEFTNQVILTISGREPSLPQLLEQARQLKIELREEQEQPDLKW